MGNNIKVTFNPDKIAAWWPAVGTYYTTTYPQNQSVFQPGIYQTTSLINPKNQQELDSVLINRYKQIDWNTWQGFPVDQKLPLVSRDPPPKPYINQSAQTFEIKPGPIIVPGIRDIPRGLVPPQTPTNRDQGRKPTPPTPPLRDTHPHLTMKNQTFHLQGFVDGLRDLCICHKTNMLRNFPVIFIFSSLYKSWLLSLYEQPVNHVSTRMKALSGRCANLGTGICRSEQPLFQGHHLCVNHVFRQAYP
nr:cell surface antigen [Marmota monax]